MKKSFKILLSAGMMLLLMQPALFAERKKPRPKDCPMGREHCPGNRGDCRMQGRGPVFGDPARMAKNLGLSEEQVKKIVDINKEFHKKMLDQREKLAPRHIQLRKMLLEDEINMGQVKSALKEISDLRMEIQLLRIQHRLDIEKVLTPDQKAKMKSHRRGMMKKGPRGPAPEDPEM